MKVTTKLMMILFTLLAGWGCVIWMQWSQDFAMNVNLLAMPIMMLVMGFLAVVADDEVEFCQPG